MEELFSNGEDCAWLAQELKNKMGGYVSFNKFGIENSPLTGMYIKSGICHSPFFFKEDVRFYIKYLRNEFLRIQIEIVLNNREDVALAMQELIKALATIKQGNEFIGLPLAIYLTDECLTSEYAFNNKELTIQSLKDNTMFDDGDVENLTFLRNCDNCIYGLNELDLYSKQKTLYCTKSHHNNVTKGNETCICHKLSTDEDIDIKALCKCICDNNK